MSILPQGFDATEIEPNAAFEPVPAGTYTVMIVDSEMKETNAKDGEYLKLTFKIVDADDEQYINRKIWSNLNLVNKNEKAVEIANRELSAICHAVGVLQPEDSQELHGIPMLAKIKVIPAQGGYDASNGISFFKPVDEA